MPREYRTIQEVAGPLMMVHGVENVVDAFSRYDSSKYCTF